MIPAIDLWRAPRSLIYTSTFGCPVEFQATIHSPCAEGDWAAIVHCPIIKSTGGHEGKTIRPVTCEGNNSMQMATDGRRHIVHHGDFETTRRAVITFICHYPGSGVCTYCKALYDIPTSLRDNRTIRT